MLGAAWQLIFLWTETTLCYGKHRRTGGPVDDKLTIAWRSLAIDCFADRNSTFLRNAPADRWMTNIAWQLICLRTETVLVPAELVPFCGKHRRTRQGGPGGPVDRTWIVDDN